MPKFNLLDSTKQYDKLCNAINRDFNCRKAFSCDQITGVCPLQIASIVQTIINNSSANGAADIDIPGVYQRVVREGLDHDVAVRVMESIFGVSLEEMKRAYR